jgi:rod shape-determining protein MreD
LRWLHFILLAYVMLGLQIGLGAFAEMGGGRVNFVLIAAVFIAINAQRDPAVIACFALGLLHDVVGVGPIGQYALAYCCVALLVSGGERSLSVEHPFTHGLVTLFGGVVVATIVLLISWWHGVRTSLADELLTALFSALMAVPAMWVLTKLRRSFRFRTSGGR